jgi:hypothetical protein
MVLQIRQARDQIGSKTSAIAALSASEHGRLDHAELDALREEAAKYYLYMERDDNGDYAGCMSIDGMCFKVSSIYVIGFSMAPIGVTLYEYERISRNEFAKMAQRIMGRAGSKDTIIDVKEEGSKNRTLQKPSIRK